MADIKRYVMAGGVLATAAAIGFVMQNGEAAQARYSAAEPVPDISGTAANPMEVTDIKLTSALAETPADMPQGERIQSAVLGSTAIVQEPDQTAEPAREPVQTAALETDTLSDAAPAQSELSSGDCPITMRAVPGAAAMVSVSLEAPCFANERVTLHHNGMMFTTATDFAGNVRAEIPALSSNSVFIAAFANGEGALASAKVDSLEFYDRLVVQSKATNEIHLNAFEFGANYREKGHVNAQSDHTMENAAKGLGGFVVSLGDADLPDALTAEIYTFPTATSRQNGDVHISVDAEVTSDNCGLQIEAQTLEVHRGGPLKVQDLTLAIPACDAVGDFLVLQNLLEDLKVARN